MNNRNHLSAIFLKSRLSHPLTTHYSRLTTPRLGMFLAASLVTAALLLISATPASLQTASTSKQVSIHLQWKRAVSEPVCLAMTQNAKFFGSVDKTGGVQLFNENGSLIWTKHVEGATDVLIAKNGQSVLVYSKLNPVYEDVYFFKADGTLRWKQQVDGPIWSGAVSPDGSYAAVTTGRKIVYVYTPETNRTKYRRWRLKGIGRRIAFTPDSQKIIIDTWQDSSLVCFDRGGKFLWETPQSSERQYELRPSADGQAILGFSHGKQLDPEVELSYWNSGGKLLWQQTLQGYDGRALVSPTSQYVAVSYANFISHGDSEIIERKVAVYGSDGQLLWQKGGLFFGPRLVALSPKGSSVIVWDGEKSLYNIDRTGRILSRFVLGGRVRSALSSDDGREIVLYCGDGWMYLLNVG